MEAQLKTRPCECEDNACVHVPSKCGDAATSRLVAFGQATYRCESCAEPLRLSGEVTHDIPLAHCPDCVGRDFWDVHPDAKRADPCCAFHGTGGPLNLSCGGDNPAVFEDEAAALDALEEPCPNCEGKGTVDVDLGGGVDGTALCGVCDGANVDLDPPRNACEAGTCGHDGC
jgi:hypothetical protein